MGRDEESRKEGSEGWRIRLRDGGRKDMEMDGHRRLENKKRRIEGLETEEKKEEGREGKKWKEKKEKMEGLTK